MGLQQLEEVVQLMGTGLEDGGHQLVGQGGGVGGQQQLQHLADRRVLVPVWPGGVKTSG